MWTKTPLAVKITVPLVLMQVSGIVIGGFALVAKIERTRLAEIDSLLSSQADLVEESLRYEGHGPQLAIEGEVVREMEHDPRVFFLIVGSKGEKLLASQGPQPRIQERLAATMLASERDPEEPYDLALPNEKWRAQIEVLNQGDRKNHPARTLYIAVDVKSATAELGMIRKMIFASAIFLAVLSALASVAIVSLTTSNLRLLARSLGAIDPLAPVWAFKANAQSAEERLLFASFQTLIDQIRKARQKQSLFIASASHELKTPVAAMMTALEVLLAKDRNVSDYQETCHDLLKTTRDLRRLTGTLLSMALLEGDAMGESDKIDLRAVVTSLYDRWSRDVKGKGINLRCEMPEEPCLVIGNMELLEVALGNFVDNAVKYSHPSGQVIIGLHKATDREYEVRIRDEGIGISKADQEKLGDLFFRADVSRAGIDSFGLGFSHAKRILGSVGAVVYVQSELKEGTEVIVRFPPV